MCVAAPRCPRSHRDAPLRRRYIQKAADEDHIADIGSAMEKYKGGFGSQAAAPRPGDMCACLFEADGCYYRGKVLKRSGDGQFEILYVDYGNTETVPATHMRSIDPALAALPPMAAPYKPSFIKLPRESADALEAVAELSGLVQLARAACVVRVALTQWQVMNRPLLIIPAHRFQPQTNSASNPLTVVPSCPTPTLPRIILHPVRGG